MAPWAPSLQAPLVRGNIHPLCIWAYCPACWWQRGVRENYWNGKMRNEWTEGKVREQGEGYWGRRTETALEEPDRKCIHHLVSREIRPSRRGLWWAWWWWRSKRGGDTSSGLQPSSGWIISQSSQMSRVSQGKLGPARAPWSSWSKTIKLPITVGSVKGAARIHATGVYAFLALPSPPTISCISLRAQQGHKPHCSTSSPAGLGWLPGAVGDSPQSKAAHLNHRG